MSSFWKLRQIYGIDTGQNRPFVIRVTIDEHITE